MRPAQFNDGMQIGELIFDTVHSINIQDYTHEQINVWAPNPLMYSTYEESYAYVAELDGKILGFTNMTFEGYLHRFYIHKDYQRQGVGSLLLDAVETKALEMGLKQIFLEASITSKPFFLAKGYQEKEKQVIVLRGMTFINHKMLKEF